MTERGKLEFKRLGYMRSIPKVTIELVIHFQLIANRHKGLERELSK